MSNAVSSTGTHWHLLGAHYCNMVDFKRAELHLFRHSGHRVVKRTTQVCHYWAIRHVVSTTLEYHVFDNLTFNIVEWVLWLPLHSAT